MQIEALIHWIKFSRRDVWSSHSWILIQVIAWKSRQNSRNASRANERNSPTSIVDWLKKVFSAEAAINSINSLIQLRLEDVGRKSEERKLMNESAKIDKRSAPINLSSLDRLSQHHNRVSRKDKKSDWARNEWEICLQVLHLLHRLIVVNEK